MSLRYEHLELDLSTAACARLREMMFDGRKGAWGFSENAVVNYELFNLLNELDARLQRRDQDPKAQPPTCDWGGHKYPGTVCPTCSAVDPNADLIA